MAANTSIVYEITPEVIPPTGQGKSHVYRIGEILRDRESRRVEYKTGGGNYSHTVLNEHIRKYGSAFLNSGGGILMIGVEDNGNVVGIHAPFRIRERIRDRIKSEFSAFTPSVGRDLYEVEFIPTNRTDYFVLEVKIHAGKDDEIYTDGENKMFVRRDGSVQGPLWPRDIREILLKKFIKKESKEHSL